MIDLREISKNTFISIYIYIVYILSSFVVLSKMFYDHLRRQNELDNIVNSCSS